MPSTHGPYTHPEKKRLIGFRAGPLLIARIDKLRATSVAELCLSREQVLRWLVERSLAAVEVERELEIRETEEKDNDGNKNESC